MGVVVVITLIKIAVRAYSAKLSRKNVINV